MTDWASSDPSEADETSDTSLDIPVCIIQFTDASNTDDVVFDRGR